MKEDDDLNQCIIIERVQMISRLITGQKPQARDKEIALSLICEITDCASLCVENSYIE